MPENPEVIDRDSDKNRPAILGQPEEPHRLSAQAEGGRKQTVPPAPRHGYEHGKDQPPDKTCFVGRDKDIKGIKVRAKPQQSKGQGNNNFICCF
ncbi:MAG: hypothetical protein KAV87_30675 [Desulfobacteraceae bacterium]|nr:hypothetical protein [Desulfobacteraceae bacterium]